MSLEHHAQSGSPGQPRDFANGREHGTDWWTRRETPSPNKIWTCSSVCRCLLGRQTTNFQDNNRMKSVRETCALRFLTKDQNQHRRPRTIPWRVSGSMWQKWNESVNPPSIFTGFSILRLFLLASTETDLTRENVNEEALIHENVKEDVDDVKEKNDEGAARHHLASILAPCGAAENSYG